MIIGNGLLAKSLQRYDRPDVLFIAAGVSDSKCRDAAAYEREKRLVKEVVPGHHDKTVVFFSTYSINDPVMSNSDYVKCKLELEDFVRSNSVKYLIIRISNLVGDGGNPSNVFNFFLQQIVSGSRFKLWTNSRRNLIAEEDFGRVLNYILENELDTKLNSTLNIINIESFSVQEIVSAIEKHTGIKAIYDEVEIQSVPPQVDEHSRRMFELLNINTNNYLDRILKKYFSGYRLMQESTEVEK